MERASNPSTFLQFLLSIKERRWPKAGGEVVLRACKLQTDHYPGDGHP
jgi:hypothetical protein